MTTRPTALGVVAGHDLTGRTCVVTGATGGLGRESARALASVGARVVMTGRSTEALDAAAAWVRASVPAADLDGVVLDLASLASVRAAAEQVRARCERVDVLMNNAGVMFTPFGRTADGFETQVGVNHLGHFALTAHLEPLLGEGSRIVALSSAGHRLGDVDLTDPLWQERDYDKFEAYGASKTANLLHVIWLDERLRRAGVSAYAVHPGVVATDLARHMSEDDFHRLRELSRLEGDGSGSGGGFEILTPEEGAATQVWAAVAPELEGESGAYLADCAVSDKVRAYALDPVRAEQLWSWSADVTGVGAEERRH